MQKKDEIGFLPHIIYILGWLNIYIYIHWYICIYIYICTYAVLCLVALLCPTLCDPLDCSPPGSSVHGILQARILEWIAMPSSRGFSQPRDLTCVSCIAGGFFTSWPAREAHLYLHLYLWSIFISHVLLPSHLSSSPELSGTLHPWPLGNSLMQTGVVLLFLMSAYHLFSPHGYALGTTWWKLSLCNCSEQRAMDLGRHNLHS